MLKIHVLINSANGIMSSNLKEELKHFDGIIDLEALDAELRELPVYVKFYNFENTIKLKKSPSVRRFVMWLTIRRA